MKKNKTGKRPVRKAAIWNSDSVTKVTPAQVLSRTAVMNLPMLKKILPPTKQLPT